jgi:hypothetical protein
MFDNKKNTTLTILGIVCATLILSVLLIMPVFRIMASLVLHQ